MQDSLVRDALLTYAADEPPMTISSTSVLDAGRRSRRRRRLAALSGAAGGVAAVGGVLALLIPALGPAPARPPITVGGPVWTQLDPSALCAAATVPAAPVPGLPPTATNAKTGYSMPVPSEPPAHAAARISCELMRAVPALLPGASFQLEPGAAGDVQPLQVAPVRVFDPARPAETSPPMIMGGAVISDAGGVGTIGFGFSPAYEPPPTSQTCQGPCVLRTGPHGEAVAVLTFVGGNGFILVNLYVYSGRTIVFVSASNGVTPPASGMQPHSLEDATVGRDDLPLTVDQLITVASSLTLTLFP
jgi:hypothetical protein